ncbi:MAG: 4a-hydroxytetrahydrobiopterin dehydratase [Chitinispirillaceae bacterium]|nr:4a-hydroxytetrahydrobiopterin dehydratase [Chitinispirillaceae bacterium]
MDLTKKHCVPCEGGTSPLSNNVEDELLKKTPGWIIDRLLEHKIKRVFTMKTFAKAIEFVNKIATVAEQEGHHPDLYISYRKVTVELCTHAILGLSENDFIMAAKINELTE